VLNKKKIFIFAITWTVFITYLSLATINSSLGSTLQIPHKDKIVHFIFYFGFVLLWTISFNAIPYKTKIGLFILLIAIVYGIVMEIFQGLLTIDRTPDGNDVIANSSGAVIGWIVAKKYLQNKNQYKIPH
jgi:VanZ family protein